MEELELAEFVVAAEAAVRSYLQRSLSASDASEAAQETLVRAIVALAKGAEPEQPAAWLRGIARNVLREELRRRRSDDAKEHRLSQPASWAGLEVSPWDDVTDRLVVHDALRRLDADLRAATVLHYLDDLPIDAIADQLHLTTGAVKTRLWRARTQLGRVLATSNARSRAMSTAGESASIWNDRPRAITVGIHVAGSRWPTAPLSRPAAADEQMSIVDVERAVAWCAGLADGLDPLTTGVSVWPAFDPFDHDDPIAVLTAVTADPRVDTSLDFTPTDAYRLGTRDDWQPVLEHAFQLGIRHLVVTLVGTDELHDELTRPGSFAAVMETIRRCHHVGVGVHVNLEINSRNIDGLADVADACAALGVRPLAYPGGTIGDDAYELLRPTVTELDGVPRDHPNLKLHPPDLWAHPLRSDGQITQAVLEGEPVDPPVYSTRGLGLHLDHNLDLRVGHVLTTPLGFNAGTDPDEARRALGTLRWPPAPPPAPELARRYGDVMSTLAHGSVAALHRTWVVAWMRDQGLGWHPMA